MFATFSAAIGETGFGTAVPAVASFAAALPSGWGNLTLGTCVGGPLGVESRHSPL